MRDAKVIDNKYLKLESTYASLPQKLFSKEYPHGALNPELILFNNLLAENLGLDKEFLQSNYGIDFLCGNKIIESSEPIAQAYAGHQFGHFTMLGDGRAVLLGELISHKGKMFDVGLKGSGITAYSRGGDGKAGLGPMLREYIVSEAMHALNIKTTRSLSVISTGEDIYRDTGRVKGAVLMRIAESFIRVGTFQYASVFTDYDTLKTLADYTLERHFNMNECKSNPYVYLLDEVIKSQAKLVASWDNIGFIHGVMNTDNVSICGETIDYGPCAFMDTYNPDTVFSSIDTSGRYAYKNQPSIAGWNLARFAESLIPLISNDKNIAIKEAEKSLSHFGKLFKESWYRGIRSKLGLFNEEEEDKALINDILNLMDENRADYTNTFLYLTLDDLSKIKMSETDGFKVWYKSWKERLKRQDKSSEDSVNLMKSCNPVVIPRNDRVEEALDKAAKREDYGMVNNLLNVVTKPYDYENINEYYTVEPEERKVPYRTYCGT